MFGLGKPRTEFGYFIDRIGKDQKWLEEITGLHRNTVGRLCNDKDYSPYMDTRVTVIRALRREGYNKTMDDFWD
jgi:hypothetical protein